MGWSRSDDYDPSFLAALDVLAGLVGGPACGSCGRRSRGLVDGVCRSCRDRLAAVPPGAEATEGTVVSRRRRRLRRRPPGSPRSP